MCGGYKQTNKYSNTTIINKERNNAVHSIYHVRFFGINIVCCFGRFLGWSGFWGRLLEDDEPATVGSIGLFVPWGWLSYDDPASVLPGVLFMPGIGSTGLEGLSKFRGCLADGPASEFSAGLFVPRARWSTEGLFEATLSVLLSVAWLCPEMDTFEFEVDVSILWTVDNVGGMDIGAAVDWRFFLCGSVVDSVGDAALVK